MDTRATNDEVINELLQPQQQITELAEIALALVGGGCGEIIVG